MLAETAEASERKKRERMVNYSPRDRTLLLKLANIYKNIIECKKTDGRTWREKERAWNKITERFNASTIGPPRTLKQLKSKYELIKKEFKKRYSVHKSYVQGTGGGPYVPPMPFINEEEQTLAETIVLSIQGLRNDFDSDASNNKTGVMYGVEPTALDMSEGVSMEYVEDDWGQADAKLLQTPKHSALTLQSYEDHQYATAVEDISEVSTPQEHIENVDQDKDIQKNDTIDEKGKNISTWTSRRRPVMAKKRCQSSASAQFELLAMKKLELVEIEKQVAEEKLRQYRVEHQKRLQILELQKEELALKIQLLQLELKK